MKILEFLGWVIKKLPFLQQLFIAIGGKKYRILYYHIVTDNIPDYYFKDKGVKFSEFSHQILNLKKYYKFITIGEALKKSQKGESLKGYCSITTDDGFIENYTVIAPFLRKEKLKATFFLINNCIDNNDLMWRNKLAYIHNILGEEKSKKLIQEFSLEKGLEIPYGSENLLTWSKRVFSMEKKEELTNALWAYSRMPDLNNFLIENKPYMSAAQIKELQGEGFEVAAHSLSHPYCDKLTYKEFEEEVIGSIEQTEEAFGQKVDIFSYPFGNRVSKDFENRLISAHGEKVKALVGIKNILDNKNPLSWERDLQEVSSNMAFFRFYLFPYVRKIIKQN